MNIIAKKRGRYKSRKKSCYHWSKSVELDCSWKRHSLSRAREDVFLYWYVRLGKQSAMGKCKEGKKVCCCAPVAYGWGTVGYAAGTPTTIAAAPYPGISPLTTTRTSGRVRGPALALQPLGFVILQPGDYRVTIAVTLFFTSVSPPSGIFNVFLLKNGQFVASDSNTVGSTSSMGTGDVFTLTGENILFDVPSSTTLSLGINHGGAGEPLSVNYFSWNITAERLTKP